ncbi:hypothetical protein FRC20_002990 [Serendipita sp. 405]|nr:hypothetical protein FRC20_002990 [Serendipita sp. 405]
MDTAEPSSASQIFRKSTRKRRLMLLASYTGDWLLTIGLAALFLALDNIDGFRRRFSLTDTTIQYPYTINERVPNWLLGVLCLGVPFVLMPIVNLISVRSFWDFHNSELGLVLSLALAGSLTNIFKVMVGRPRPDAIDRCQPRPGSHNADIYGLVDTSICTQTSVAIMRDGWRSFCSGHSSLSFAGLGFLSFYLAGKLHLFDRRGHTGKAWISVFPLFGAAAIAATRTMDYRHHWQDVLVGGTVGILSAYFSYRQYYESLEHPSSHLPFGPRIPPVERQNESAMAEVVGGAPGKGKGRDIEAGHATEEDRHEDHSVAGTLPRKPVSLERVWSESSHKARKRESANTAEATNA